MVNVCQNRHNSRGQVQVIHSRTVSPPSIHVATQSGRQIVRKHWSQRFPSRSTQLPHARPIGRDNVPAPPGRRRSHRRRPASALPRPGVASSRTALASTGPHAAAAIVITSVAAAAASTAAATTEAPTLVTAPPALTSATRASTNRRRLTRCTASTASTPINEYVQVAAPIGAHIRMINIRH